MVRYRFPEDHLTGEAVIFSTEKLIRLCGEVMYGRRAAVFGYGKVGRSIARALQSRGVRVSVVEINPVRAVEAAAHGFRILEKKFALTTCELIFGATGNFSIGDEDFGYIRNGAFIASVTSSDDEMEIGSLSSRYGYHPIREWVGCYSKEGHFFYVLHEGNAVNFLDGAVLGPYIFLVQAEILAGLTLLRQSSSMSHTAHEIPDQMRRSIAQLWFDVFFDHRIIIPGTM